MIFEIIFTVLIIKVIVDVTKGRCVSRNRLDGKTVLLTGANSGIGVETARELAKRGARIIMASRNTFRSEAIRDAIVKETNNTNIVVKQLDVSLFTSVRDFVTDIRKTEDKIDILIHNAGIGQTDTVTEENVNSTLATNLYGPYLLTVLLIDLLKKAPSARVIFVSSLMAFTGQINFEQLDYLGNISKSTKSMYGISKYGEILLAHEMTERLKGTNIMVNTLHPGVIITPIFEYNQIGKMVVRLFWFLCKSEEEGAQTTLHLAIDPVGGQVSGKYFVDCRQFTVYDGDYHRTNGQVLWDRCEHIVKLSKNEPRI